MNESVINLLSFLTLLADIVLVILLIIYALPRHLTAPLRLKLGRLANKYGLPAILGITLASVLGSLFFSEVALYQPCVLCWYQRIFLYPQAVLALVALIKKDKSVVDYLIPLSVIGGLISLYNYSLQIKASILPFDATAPCSLDGASCSATYFLQFGYVTLPVMALTAFLFIILISLLIKKGEK